MRAWISFCVFFLMISAVAVSAAPAQDDFDIRLSHEKAEIRQLQQLRAANPAGQARAQAARGQARAAQRALEARTRRLEVIDSAETGGPEVIGPARGHRALTNPKAGPKERIARDFLEENAAAYGLSRAQAAQLRKDADYANPKGNLHWVRLKQRIHNRPVFRGEVTVALTPSGEIVRTTGQLAPAIDENEAPKQPVIDAAVAVSAAAAEIGVNVDPEALVRMANAGQGNDGRTTFERGPFSDPITAELLYFPLGDGSVDLAWSIHLWTEKAAYWSIVSATSGVRLFQKNLTNTASNTYRVYPSDSPAPFSPGPTNPTLGQQAPLVPATLVTVDYLSTTTSDPWLAPGVAVTDGNNAEAGLDLLAPNGVDAPVATTGPNTFDYPFNPPPGDPAPGDDPTTPNSRNGAVVNLFYLTNRYHDQLYDLGFTEAAGNFQHDNYGRGGVGGDRVSAEAQDSSGTNNANFSTPSDGTRGRMQMYLWSAPTPDRDGDLDAEIVYHELTHGTSNRLHGDASGLNTNMSRGMGEGWSDFYAEALLSEPSDPVNGIYTIGGYSTYQIVPGFTGNYYYGIRRFPRAPITFLGPNGKPHNPLTFADIDSTQANLADGAYPRGPVGVPEFDQVHNAGEIWSSALWEARANLINANGYAVGNQLMLQNVTDGMKLDPVGPTFLQARDSIISADCAANAGANELAIWAGFAARGMGLNARVLAAGTGNNSARVVEDFTGPTPANTPLSAGSVSAFNASCGLPGRNPIPGETVELTVVLGNPYCSQALTGLTVSVQGGGSTVVGTLSPGATTTATVPYTIPSNTCGTTLPLVFDITHDAGAQTLGYALPVGPQATATLSFSNSAPITIPSIGVAAPYPSTLNVSGIGAPVVGLTVTLHGFNHTFFGDTDFLLVAPDGKKMVFMSDAFDGFASPSTLTMDLTLADDAAFAMPPSGSPPNVPVQSWKPTDYGSGDVFAAPAPAGPYLEPQAAGSSTFASAFAGIDPNGTWSLYVVDDTGGDSGAIAGGWTLGVIVPQVATCTACGPALGGTVSGLAAGNSVTLQNNGVESLVVSANGSFIFPTGLVTGQPYAVTVLTQPTTPSQLCTVTNGTGTTPAGNVSNVDVTCVTLPTIGGTVAGLAAGNSVTLQNNGGDDLVVPADGSFTFVTGLATGAAYAVTVLTQPTAPSQLCTVTNGSGTIPAGNVSDVSVACITIPVIVAQPPPAILAENALPPNNAADPGETLTVDLPLASTLGVDTTNLVATLRATGGVTLPSAAQSYGVVVAGGAVVSRPYTFVAAGDCGSDITLTLDLVDGALPLGSISYTMRLGTGGSQTFSNPASMTIPDYAPTPPPPVSSQIAVAGMVGNVTDLSVKLNGVTHTWPADIDVLLVGPGGQSMLLMSDIGGSVDLTGQAYVLSDAAASSLATGNVLNPTGSYRPTNFTDTTGTDVFAAPAPAGPYGSPAPTGSATLASVFAGTPANGTWTLYVRDDAIQDLGSLADGWELSITTAATTTCSVPPTGYTIGGTVSGLAAGNSVTLRNNGVDDAVVGSNGAFTFMTSVDDAGSYAVTVQAQPTTPNQTCTVTNGSGTVAGANVTNVAVNCVTDTYTVGGTLSNLGAGGSVTLRNNGGDDLVLGADGAFTFTTAITDGGSYAVTVFAQPSSPAQTCSVSNGSGSIAGANVSSVLVSCLYTPSISVTGYNVTYDGLPHTATGTATGLGGVALETLDLSGTTHTDAGTYTDPWTFTSADPNYSNASGTVANAIGKATLTVKAENKAKFFLDPNPPLTYTITGFVNGEPASVVSGAPNCGTTATTSSPVGSYPITCTLGTLAATNYNFAFVPGTLAVAPRDALVNYIGQTTWVVSGNNTTSTQVTLSASVQDPTGLGLVGAKVNFKDLGSGRYLATNVAVAPVANAPASGTANTVVTLSSGQYGAESYLILVEMTGGYTNALQPAGDKTASISVAKTAAKFQTIGIGSLAALPTAAGTYLGNGDDVSYTIGMAYNKSGANLQGKITVTVPQADGMLWIKSNSISSMSTTATLPKTSTIYTKSTVYKVTPAGTVNIDGNVTLRIDAVDGAPDQVGITVLSSKDSTLYYSNQWLLVPTGGQSVWKTVPETVINAPPITVSSVSIQ